MGIVSNHTVVDEPRAEAGAEAPVAISACIIARNEQESLPGCLASVAFCQEIVLVDSGSTDATMEIARAAGARVIENAWRGFAAQRNVALDHARGEWVLEIDADERVSPRLREEIEAFLANPPGVDLAGLPVREIFLGHPLGPSGKYPKYRHRLVRRGSYRHDERRTVHEGFVPEGPVHPFTGDLIHLLATDWGEAVGDCWRYARLEAGQLSGARTPGRILRGALLRPAVKLIYRLAVDGGWRDGWAGAAKIGLDCATDSLVWIRYLLGARGSELGDSGVGEGEHYGSWKVRRGPLHVVAVAGTGSDSARAADWLAGAARAGADVALLTPAPADSVAAAAGHGVRLRRLERLGPLALIRALDAEEQLRSIDGVLAFGSAANLVLRLVPRGLRGPVRDLRGESDPSSLSWDAAARGEANPA
jgi:glycosyltransferase involved in cell wall biosynthesis